MDSEECSGVFFDDRAFGIGESEQNKTESSTMIVTGKRWRDFFIRRPLTANKGVGDFPVRDPPKKRNKWLFWKKHENATNEPDYMKDTVGVSSLQDLNRTAKAFHVLKKEANHLNREVIASAISSLLSTVISHPLEVLKYNFQSVRYPKQCKCSKRRPSLYFVAKDIFKKRGFMHFYAGHLRQQRYSLYQTISMFYTYHQANLYFWKVETIRNKPDFMAFASGFISATIPVMVVQPIFDLERRRLNQKKSIEKHGRISTEKMVREMSFRPSFRGWHILFLHVGTLYGLRFLFFNRIRDQFKARLKTHDKATSTDAKVSEVDTIIKLPYTQVVFAGGIAAVLSDLIAHPLDVIYTRIKMSSLKRQQYRFDHTCRRLLQCSLMILRTERLLAFYSGLLPCILRSTVNMAVQFAVYERTKYLLRPYFPT